MYIEGTESWSLVTSSDTLLNFAIYTGCLYGLIEDDNKIIRKNKLWPPKSWCNQLTEAQLVLLKEQWNKWFEGIAKDRGEKVISKHESELYRKNDMFDPPEFLNFPYDELKECIKNAWKPFIEWWEMPGGGKNALSYFEVFDMKGIYKYINEFENIVGRKVKPFNLYIDMIYTGTTETIEVNNEYVIMAPIKPIYFNKEWWLKKLEQIG
jgi:hypothetical protein